MCAVSGAKFLAEGGWIDLRNPVDADVPFRLFRDEGRTFLQVSNRGNEVRMGLMFLFLQWIGDPDLRLRMSGRLVLVHLLCRELASAPTPVPDVHSVFTPCVAFRVVGTPSKYLYSKYLSSSLIPHTCHVVGPTLILRETFNRTTFALKNISTLILAVAIEGGNSRFGWKKSCKGAYNADVNAIQGIF